MPRRRNRRPRPKNCPCFPPSGRWTWTRRRSRKARPTARSPAPTSSPKRPSGQGRHHLPAPVVAGRRRCRRTVGSMVYLRLNAGESVTGRTWTVSQELKGKTLPQVVKLWKTNPRYAAAAEDLLLGLRDESSNWATIADGVISGKIFLAVPDTEQSVVAGVFKATTTLADASGAAAASPVAERQPGRLRRRHPAARSRSASRALRRQEALAGTLVYGGLWRQDRCGARTASQLRLLFAPGEPSIAASLTRPPRARPLHDSLAGIYNSRPAAQQGHRDVPDADAA